MNRDHASGKYSADSPPDSVLAFNKELKASDEQINHFRSRLRRALLVVDDHDLVNKLRALETVGGQISDHAQSIRDRAVEQKTIDVTKLHRDLTELSKTSRSLADAAVTRLKASG